jgi:hypothetical protein
MQRGMFLLSKRIPVLNLLSGSRYHLAAQLTPGRRQPHPSCSDAVTETLVTKQPSLLSLVDLYKMGCLNAV